MKTLGEILAPSWGVWGPSWLQVGGSWLQVGGSDGDIGSKLGGFGAILAPSCLGVILAPNLEVLDFPVFQPVRVT